MNLFSRSESLLYKPRKKFFRNSEHWKFDDCGSYIGGPPSFISPCRKFRITVGTGGIRCEIIAPTVDEWRTVNFEELFESVPDDIRKELAFNMDLFV